MATEKGNVMDEMSGAIAEQGDLATLDASTGTQAQKLQQQLGGGPDGAGPATGFFIWGSIRILSVSGKWSFWRKTKRPISLESDARPRRHMERLEATNNRHR